MSGPWNTTEVKQVRANSKIIAMQFSPFALIHNTIIHGAYLVVLALVVIPWMLTLPMYGTIALGILVAYSGINVSLRILLGWCTLHPSFRNWLINAGDK